MVLEMQFSINYKPNRAAPLVLRTCVFGYLPGGAVRFFLWKDRKNG